MKIKIEEHLKKNNYKLELKTKKNEIITLHNYKGKEYKVLGELNKGFPFVLPTFKLLNRSNWKLLAHVTWSKENNYGLICTGVSINRNIDYHSHEIVYEKALLEVIKTLEASFDGGKDNEKEIMKEFNAHWRERTYQNKIINFIESSDKVKRIKCFKKGNINFFLDEDSNFNEKYSYLNSLKKSSSIEGKGVYIPFPKGILPPKAKSSLSEWWKNLLIKFPKIKNEIKKILNGKKSQVYWVISSIKVEDKLSWFSLKFESKTKNKLPLGKKDNFKTWNLTSYDVRLHNKEYMLPRGGAKESKGKNKLLLVGCGSVGGELAMTLAGSGQLSSLTLVDYDIMSIDNTYRHILGGKYIGKSKVKALKNEILEKYPYIEVIHNDNISKNHLKDIFENYELEKYDGIIIATGDPTSERYFNENTSKLKNKPWVVYTWLEGYGAGGHTIYVHNKGKGCLSCLYRNTYGEKSLHSIQNFLEGEQSLAVDISGCGSNFLPYSRLDAVETALLASRVIMKALAGKIDESKKISWKGELDTSIELRTTRRYREKEENCLKLLPLAWKGCDICEN